MSGLAIGEGSRCPISHPSFCRPSFYPPSAGPPAPGTLSPPAMRARVLSLLSFSLALLTGCGPAERPAAPPAPLPTTAPFVASASPAAASAGPQEPSSSPSSPPAKPTLPPAGPPPSFTPPHPKTAKEGDGAWQPLAVRGGAPSPLHVTTLHVHPLQAGVTVTVVAIDLSRTRVHLVAGTKEPEASPPVPDDRRTGLVPAAHHGALLAVMNGGWKAQHGHFGMRLGDDVFLPPKDAACAVALDDGRVVVGPWSDLAAGEKRFEAYRQTPACLIHEGKVHPDLVKDAMSRKWGATDKGGVEIRRSALGVDGTGRWALFGLGENTSARAMADGMLAAGAVSAAELDVNWSYTRFFLYADGPGGSPVIARSLVTKIDAKPTAYVERPSERDFFYVVRRERLSRQAASARQCGSSHLAAMLVEMSSSVRHSCQSGCGVLVSSTTA